MQPLFWCQREVWRNLNGHPVLQADFSLLFHASVGNNKVAVEKLLQAGADPTLSNLKGTNVFMMFVKRGQIEMAEMCLAKVFY